VTDRQTHDPRAHSVRAAAVHMTTENTTMKTTTIAPAAATTVATPTAATAPSSGRVLMAACNQWMSRPADQRFGSLDALHDACAHHRDVAVEARNVDLRTLEVGVNDYGTAVGGDDEPSGPEPVLIGSSGSVARFTNYGFQQLARRVGAPADYLRKLPPALVAENMNHGLQRAEHNGSNDALLFAKNGDLRLRAALSDSYKRIWNADVTSRLLRLVEQQPEWQPAPEAFDGSRGLYASDADMFAFLVDNERRIFERGPAGGLGRGFFVSNSEVGAGAFAITTFFYEYVCGNHRVWGASGVQELRIRHVGNADDRAFAELSVELRKYADGSAKDDEAKVAAMQARVLGKDKDAVLDAVFGLRFQGITRKVLEQSYEVAVAHEDWYGSPNTVWGITGGMTQVARDVANASDRVALERAAGKVMQIAF